jgi:hypothetical protein
MVALMAMASLSILCVDPRQPARLWRRRFSRRWSGFHGGGGLAVAELAWAAVVSALPR